MQAFLSSIKDFNIRTHEFYMLILGLILILLFLFIYYTVNKRKQYKKDKSEKLRFEAQTEKINKIEKDIAPLQGVEIAIKGIDEAILRLSAEMRNTQQSQIDAITGQIRSAILLNKENVEFFQKKLSQLESQFRLLNANAQNHQFDSIHEELTEMKGTVLDGLKTIAAKRQEESICEPQFYRRNTLNPGKDTGLETKFSESMERITERVNSIENLTAPRSRFEDTVIDLLQVNKIRNLEGILHRLLMPNEYRSNVRIGTDESRADYVVILPDEDRPSRMLPIDAGLTMSISFKRMNHPTSKDIVERLDIYEEAFIKEITEYAYRQMQALISPPTTTDFAVLYVDNEEAFTRILNKQGLIDQIYRDIHVLIVNSSMLITIIQSLRCRRDLVSINESVNVMKTELITTCSVFEKIVTNRFSNPDDLME